MCRSHTLTIALCLAFCGCTIPLDHTDASDASGSDTTTVNSCALFAGTAPSLGVGHSVGLPDGVTLWTFDGGGGSFGLAAVATPVQGGCPGSLSTPVAALPANASATDFATPLDLVRVAGDVWQFYEAWRFEAGAPFGVKVIGRGVAKWDAASGHFTRTSALLWAADRPNFGASAIVDGVWVFAYGCSTTESGWSRACYVARAPTTQVDNLQAWRYATSVDAYTDNIDDAQPIVTGVGDLAVRRHASGRLLATYVKPLDTVLQVRSMLTPSGPFSAPHALGLCPQAPSAFCMGGVQHPELDPNPTTIALTFALSSFDVLAADLRWPRLALLQLPPELP